jgi:hypothetical protein
MGEYVNDAEGETSKKENEGWCSVNALDWYSSAVWFGPRKEHTLSRLWLLMFLLSPFIKILG